MELTEEVKVLLLKTAKDLKGCVHRMFMARTVEALSTFTLLFWHCLCSVIGHYPKNFV